MCGKPGECQNIGEVLTYYSLALRRSLSVNYLVPKAVGTFDSPPNITNVEKMLADEQPVSYIEEHGLYRDENSTSKRNGKEKESNSGVTTKPADS